MHRLLIIAFVLLQGCAQFSLTQSASEPTSGPNDHVTANASSELEGPDSLAPTHLPVYEEFVEDFAVAPLVQPHAPNGWLVEYDHEPLPVDVVEAINRPSDLLQRLRQGFTFDLETTNPRIEAQLKWYIRNPEYLNRVFTRAARYMYHIVERLEEEGLPLELALLPVVESAYDAFAYSHGRASGLWQFIPGTGRSYGLHQSWWFDGRRDVLLSTEAAITYLSLLHKRFDNNWMHALASYNTGQGRLARSIKRNKKLGKPTDFWSLKLPRETRAYVPKLIAIAKVVATPEKYNLKLKPVPNQPYFKIVKLDSQIDLAQAAALAGIDIEEIYQLNPGLNQWATPPTGPFRLLMPVMVADKFKQQIAALPKSQRLTWDNYRVKKGDSLGKIANKFYTTPELIRQVNRLRGNTIYQNQELLIPVASKNKRFYNLSEQNRLASIQTKVQGKNGASKVFHKVKTGDTFWDIARAHKVGVRQIAKWNGMAPGDVLRPGKTLLIWSNTAGKQPAIASKGTTYLPNINQSYDPRDKLKRVSYKVRSGDSLWLIASRFKVSVKDLKRWNNIGSKHIRPGQRLTVFVDITRG